MAQYANYYDYLTGSGVIVPDTENVLSDVQQEWRDVFGQNLSVEPETPQGRIIELIARQRVFTLQMAAATSNMLNIDKSYGFILDDIGSLFQIQRKSATYTTTQITMSGVADTVIPVGTRLRSDEGYLFENDDEYIIGSNGAVTGVFRAVESGVIPAEQGTITTIVTSVAGLESVINNANAKVGEEQESDQEFRNRIKASLNINSVSVLSAIQSAVGNIEGVLQVKAYENTAETPSVLNTIFAIPPHSIGIIVDYIETDLENQPVAYAIAEAIYKKKTLGAGYITANDGNASIKQTTGDDLSDLAINTTTFETQITDFGVYKFTYDGSDWYLGENTVDLNDYGITFSGTESSGDVITVYYPSGVEYIKSVAYTDEFDEQTHTVVFATPIPRSVACSITVKRQFYTGDDLEGAVKSAIADFLAGDNPEVDRVNIGGVLSPFEIASAVSSVIPDIFITSVLIGDEGEALGTAVIQLGDAEKLVINPENITVTINE